MKKIEVLLAALKQVLFSFTPNRSVLEGMLKYDFKLGDPVQSLMQISFSALANWPLYALIFLVWIDPTRGLWSLHRILGEESSVGFFLLDGQLLPMTLFFAGFFVLEWIFKKDFFFIILLFYFLARSELHLHLTLAGTIGIYLARACYLARLFGPLESRTKSIWGWVVSIQIFSVVMATLITLGSLDQVWPRFYYMVGALFTFHILNFMALAIWGHFYTKIKNDPSYWPIHYSTADWPLDSMNLSKVFKAELRRQAQAQTKSHLASLAQVQEMKDQSLGIRVSALESILNKELGYLQTGASRLTID